MTVVSEDDLEDELELEDEIKPDFPTYGTDEEGGRGAGHSTR